MALMLRSELAPLFTAAFQLTLKAGNSGVPHSLQMESDDYILILLNVSGQPANTYSLFLELFQVNIHEFICSVIFCRIQSPNTHHIYLLWNYNKACFKSCGKRDLSTGKEVPCSL